MKKAILFIACFAIMVVTMSSTTDGATAPVVGYQAPAVSLTGTDADAATLTLDDCRGEYVLLTFWSSGDAASRLRCNAYTSLERHDDVGVRHIAVNFDRSAALYCEIVNRDNLNALRQYHVEGNAARIIKDKYHLDRGLHSFLIDPRGTIIAIDPDAEQVTSLS